MNKGSQWWISGTFITSFIIFCWLIQTSHCLAGWNSVSHPAPYLLVNRELKHLLQPCEFDLWSWWSNFVIVSDIKMHEFLFGNHFLVWGVCFTIFGEGCFNILLVVCMLAFEESFYVTFFFSYCFCISHLHGIIGEEQHLLFWKISITLLFPRIFPQGTIHLVHSVALFTDWKWKMIN